MKRLGALAARKMFSSQRKLFFRVSVFSEEPYMQLKIQDCFRLVLFCLVVFALNLACGALVVAADKHPFGIDDYSALRRARSVAVSPDGKNVLFQVSFDGEKGPAKHEWHLIEVSGKNDRKLDCRKRSSRRALPKRVRPSTAHSKSSIGASWASFPWPVTSRHKSSHCRMASAERSFRRMGQNSHWLAIHGRRTC